MDSPTLYDVVELALGAEREARKFYGGLARRFSSYPGIRDFWHGMELDEEDHAAEIERLRDSLSAEQLQAPEPIELYHKAREFLSFNADDLLKGVRTLDDAYRMAVNLEFSEINKLMELLINRHVEESSQREKTVALLEAHLKKISDFKRSFGGADKRKAIRASGD